MNIDETNARISQAEVEHFKARQADRLGSYTAYLSADRKTITTGVGDVLATVTSETHHRNRIGFMTDERGSFWARGIDGRIYHGRHNGPGMYCRLRLAKDRRVGGAA